MDQEKGDINGPGLQLCRVEAAEETQGGREGAGRTDGRGPRENSNSDPAEGLFLIDMNPSCGCGRARCFTAFG